METLSGEASGYEEEEDFEALRKALAESPDGTLDWPKEFSFEKHGSYMIHLHGPQALGFEGARDMWAREDRLSYTD